MRVLLQVQRKGDSGSPRLKGSTNASNTPGNRGSRTTKLHRPPPGRRTRSSGKGELGQFADPLGDGNPRQPAGAADHRHAAISYSQRFRSRQHTPGPLIEMRPYQHQFVTNVSNRNHAAIKDSMDEPSCKCYLLTRSKFAPFEFAGGQSDIASKTVFHLKRVAVVVQPLLHMQFKRAGRGYDAAPGSHQFDRGGI